MLDQNSGQHVMDLDVTHDSGTEEWFCPVCGRRMVIQWAPSFKWMILEAGDEHAAHSGAKGGLKIHNITTSDQEEAGNSETDLSEEDEPRLAPWQEWLDKIDFDKLWNEKEK